MKRDGAEKSPEKKKKNLEVPDPAHGNPATSMGHPHGAKTAAGNCSHQRNPDSSKTQQPRAKRLFQSGTARSQIPVLRHNLHRKYLGF